MSKSHGNTSMYVDTVINFAKITTYIHTHTTYILRTYYILHTTYRISDHIVSQARQKYMIFGGHKLNRAALLFMREYVF